MTLELNRRDVLKLGAATLAAVPLVTASLMSVSPIRDPHMKTPGLVSFTFSKGVVGSNDDGESSTPSSSASRL